MTSEQLKENIETERAEAKSLLMTPRHTKKEHSVVQEKARNCLRRLKAYQSQLESIDSKAAEDAALKEEARQKTKDLPDVPSTSVEERLAKLIVSDLPEVPKGKVELEKEKVLVAELED